MARPIKGGNGMFKRNGKRLTRHGFIRLAVIAAAAAMLTSAVFASAAGAEAVKVRKAVFTGFAAPETPEHLDKVGVIKVSPKKEAANNVLVLEPGTSAGAAYF